MALNTEPYLKDQATLQSCSAPPLSPPATAPGRRAFGGQPRIPNWASWWGGGATALLVSLLRGLVKSPPHFNRDLGHRARIGARSRSTFSCSSTRAKPKARGFVAPAGQGHFRDWGALRQVRRPQGVVNLTRPIQGAPHCGTSA